MTGLAFVDSAVLIAAMHERDRDHERGLPILRAADAGEIEPLELTDFVLAETINYLTSRGGSHVGREALERLEGSSGFEIQRVPDTAFDRGKNDVFHEFDGLSLVDAVTVATMEHREVETVYTFDSDFDRVPWIERRTTV